MLHLFFVMFPPMFIIFHLCPSSFPRIFLIPTTFAASLLKVANFGSMTSNPLALGVPAESAQKTRWKPGEKRCHCQFCIFLEHSGLLVDYWWTSELVVDYSWKSSVNDVSSSFPMVFGRMLFQVVHAFPAPFWAPLPRWTRRTRLLLHLLDLLGGVVRSAGGPADGMCRWRHGYVVIKVIVIPK